jgi:DNA (cytosine-5)-methyltransferase 1
VTALANLELCSGGGGLAIGTELAGFRPVGLVDVDPDCCRTLRQNRPKWPVYQGDVADLDGTRCRGLGLISAGLPCPPHSRAGKRLGAADERHLWSQAMPIIAEARPRAVLIETVDGIMAPAFDAERAVTTGILHDLGFVTSWRVVDASHFAVPQRRRRAVLVGFAEDRAAGAFRWPEPHPDPPLAVGDVLLPLMGERGWPGAAAWAAQARDLAPTIVGGSAKHGGPDLGPSQTKAAWRRMGLDPLGVADEAPGADGKYQRGACLVRDAGEHGPMLTVAMGARLQGFPPGWRFCGGKTSQWHQVGNACPPPLAAAVSTQIRLALEAASSCTGSRVVAVTTGPGFAPVADEAGPPWAG